MEINNHPFIAAVIQQQKKSYLESLLQNIAKYMGPQCITLYQDIKQHKQPMQKYQFPTLQFFRQNTQSNICAKILVHGTKAFKCHDCIYQSNSIMCVQCFQKSDHKGHIYELISVFGGCCDCGDEQKWNPKGSCKKHNDSSNLVQKMKQKVDAKQQKEFINSLKFCFIYFFLLYNQAELQLKNNDLKETSEIYKKKLEQADKFCTALIKYLSNFNTDSLISNIMTYNLLKSPLNLQKIDQAITFQFIQNFQQYSIFQILLKCLKLQQKTTIALIVDLFTQLFTIRQFKRQLTVVFVEFHNQDDQFPMSGFNHLSCQLLTSHKMIQQLVQSREIKPLVYFPKASKMKNYEDLARNFVRYYIDIEYLSKLYKQSSEIYLTYHINQGFLPALAFYRNLSYEFNDSVNYYGLEEIYLSKFIKIVKVINSSKHALQTLQKGIKDEYKQCLNIYQQHFNHFFNESIDDEISSKYLYLSHQLSLSLLIFSYFQKLDQQHGEELNIKQKINLLMQILKLNRNAQSKNKVLAIIKILHNALIFLGLCLGHKQTMERFYTYFSFSFKKSFTTFNLTLYLYKILILILKQIHEENPEKMSIKPLSTLFINETIFQRPIRQMQDQFNKQSYSDDDQSIFDRKKCMIRLSYFINILIQATQTDIHQTLLSITLQLNKKAKYQKKVMKFYLQILKNYKKMKLKEFKQIADQFFTNDQIFEEFISKSKQIVISHGNIVLKSQINNSNQNSKQKPNQTQSEVNLFYLKSFKHKLINANEKQSKLIIPQSSNHLLYLVISQNLVKRLLCIISSYIDLISLEQGKIKQQQTGVVSNLIIQVIKISKSFKNIPQYIKISHQIIKVFKYLQSKKHTLETFPQQIIKIMCEEIENDQSYTELYKLNQHVESKAEERKQRLLQKKNKKLAKFKSNYEKYQQIYSSELKNIRDQLQQQAQAQNQPTSQSSNSKCCIICRESHTQKDILKSDISLMGYMQLSDMYYHFLSGKKQKQNNCNLVFKTCGHYIHLQCHNKINENKEYALCQLCKATVNCLFPVNVQYYYESQFIQQHDQDQIYQQLKATLTRLYIIDCVLRQNCENGFGNDIQDQSEMKQKLIDSLVNMVIFTLVEENKSFQQKQQKTFFEKKQLPVYKNILVGLKVFIKHEKMEELESIQKNVSKRIKKNEQQHQNQQKRQQKNQKRQPKLFSRDNQMRIDNQKYQNQFETFKLQKTSFQNNPQILQNIKNYLRTRIQNYIYDKSQKLDKTYKLSDRCLYVIQNILSLLKGENKHKIELQYSAQKLASQQKQEQIFVCQQICHLKPLIRFYFPPQQLEQLFRQRGKCPNCDRITNHIVICFICQWHGCRQCIVQSVFNHNNKKHNGNSIYIQAHLGHIYFVSRKKYWIFPSIYQDYLGNCLKQYHVGVKLEKYTLNKSKLKKIYKNLVNYDIEMVIRYEEFRKKKTFIVNI